MGIDQHDQRACSDCGAALATNQRYCLDCGSRQATPRLDFTAFFARQTRPRRSAVPPLRREPHATPWRPQRRLSAALLVAVTVASCAAGATLGSTPGASTAASPTLGAALAALASSGAGRVRQQPHASPANKGLSTRPVSRASAPRPASSGASGAESAEGPSGALQSPAEAAPSEEAPAGGSGGGGEPSSNDGSKPPPIKHVWLIALPRLDLIAAIADPSRYPYLARQLAPKGTLLAGYAPSASSELANGIALISGQGPTKATEQDCPTYLDVQPPTIDTTTGLASGEGCIYPAAVHTLADELAEAGLPWRAYVGGMGTISCLRPQPSGPSPTQAASSPGSYTPATNPFVYFHSLLDGGSRATSDLDLSRLPTDLEAAGEAPALSWLTPATLAAAPGPSQASTAEGPRTLDSFLKETVPRILASASYHDGLVALVPLSAPQTPGVAESPATEPAKASSPLGALLISPFTRAGARVGKRFEDYSLLKSLERIYGVLPLGHANDTSVASFDATVYGTSAPTGSSPPSSSPPSG